MAENDTYPILNPYTPLAFLEPELADTTSIFRYVVVGSLSVVIWDLLQAFPEDYRVIFRHTFSIKTVIFILSRVLNLAFLAVAAVLCTAELPDCNATNKAVWALYVAAYPCSSLLLLYRLYTLFQKQHLVVGAFFCGLLLIIGGSITTIFATSGSTIGPTQYCILNIESAYLCTAIVTAFVFDIAISATLIHKIKTTPDEEPLPLSSSKLQRVVLDGRLYFHIIALLKVPLIILYFTLRHRYGASSAIQLVFLFPSVALGHILSARIHRDRQFRKTSLLPTSKSGVAPPGNMSFNHRSDLESNIDSLPHNALYTNSKTDTHAVSDPPAISDKRDDEDDEYEEPHVVSATNVVKFDDSGKSEEFMRSS